MTISLYIRAGLESDIEAVVALWERCGLTRPWNDPRRDFSMSLGAANSTVLCGFIDDSLVASVMAGFDGHRGWVYYLSVDPGKQGMRFGRAMMSAAERWLRQIGAPKLQLMVRSDNEASLAFYECQGFEVQSVVTLGKRLTVTAPFSSSAER
jgi:ribosomal protein S18 acetylase RimI-like enzyme